MPSSSEPRSLCPVVFALDVFGDRWTLLIVRDMALRGFSTYGQLLEAGEGISTNILADRLKRLEEQEIVTKRDDPDHGARYQYRLTRKGLDLVPVLVEMMRWSTKHDDNTPVPKSFQRRLDREPRKVAEEFIRRAKGDNQGGVR